MTDEEAQRRFSEARVARLATVTATNDPHLVPICFAVDGDTGTIYSAVDAKPKTTPDLKRLRNIEANPRVTLLVDHYDDDWTRIWWVRVDGHAAVENHEPRAVELLTAKYRQYLDNPHSLGRIVVVQPARWRWWAFSNAGR
ncbi:MAG: TIGR03668 family PPOX class F420-dependent oxidoreductase [Acidimicrobiia bacterium]|nr:TIGR03668 family PPOX class F420-dependent oxidoreductase [Acidimicrobiia bacterium]